MCFFVEINLSRQELHSRFNVPMREDPRYMPGYFHAAFNRPFLPAISSDNPDQIGLLQWGLIPFWVKDQDTAEKIRNSTYNAKSETLWEKPSFRAAVKYRRCLILVHGFFEYHTRTDIKIPYYVKLKSDQPFALAGVFEEWTNPESGEIFQTTSIITTEANPLMRKIHNSKKRMPVILKPEDEKIWIDKNAKKEPLRDLLVPFEDSKMEAYSVSRKILDKNLDIRDPSIIEEVNYANQVKLF